MVVGVSRGERKNGVWDDPLNFPSNARERHAVGLWWLEVQALTVSVNLAESGLVLFSVVGDEGYIGCHNICFCSMGFGHEELGVMELSPHFWHFYSYIYI